MATDTGILSEFESTMRRPDTQPHVAQSGAAVLALVGRLQDDIRERDRLLEVCRDNPRAVDEDRIATLEAENERLAARVRELTTYRDELIASVAEQKSDAIEWRTKLEAMEKLMTEGVAHDHLPLPDFEYAAFCCEESLRGEPAMLNAPTYSSTFSAKALRHVAARLRGYDELSRVIVAIAKLQRHYFDEYDAETGKPTGRLKTMVDFRELERALGATGPKSPVAEWATESRIVEWPDEPDILTNEERETLANSIYGNGVAALINRLVRDLVRARRAADPNADLVKRIETLLAREKLALRVLSLVQTPGREVTKRMIDAFERWCGNGADPHAIKNYALNALLAYATETVDSVE